VFTCPVDPQYKIQCEYAEKNKRFAWSIDPENGLWLPSRDRDGFGHHRGLDFSCPVGTIVRAMVDGIIIRSRFENALDSTLGSGLYIFQLVMLVGYDSWCLKYSHLKASYVSVGQKVKAGEGIAESGQSGDAISPFLHVDLMNLKKQWKNILFDA